MERKTHFFSISTILCSIILFCSTIAADYQHDSFLWGTAVAEFQNSGAKQLPHSNWAHFEKTKTSWGSPHIEGGQKSGKSVDSWNNIKEDVELMKKMGLSTFRFSIDWSSIEPHPGQINEAALKHYDDLCDALIKANITPMASLHHFTHPHWFDEFGGFENEENIKYFENFSKLVFNRYSSKIPLWCTINEISIYPFTGYLLGIHSPGKNMATNGLQPVITVTKNLLKAHVRVYKALKALPNGDKVSIGFVHNILKFKPRYWWEPLERTLCNFFTYITNTLTMKFFKTGVFKYECLLGLYEDSYTDITAPESFDFFGLNYYADPVLGFNTKNLFGSTCFPHQMMGEMDLPLDPEGFGQAIREAAQLKKPIYITEHGVADSGDKDGNDAKRQQTLIDCLNVIDLALKDDIDIRGYYHWTLLSNFEWDRGWNADFGLSDRNRNLRPSGVLYKKLIEEYNLKTSFHKPKLAN